MSKKITSDKVKNQKGISVRINKNVTQKSNIILQNANKKKFGRKIKLDDLLEICLDRITEDDIKMLQNKSIRPDERKEIMRQKYIDIYGEISKAKFTEFMMSAEYISFLKDHFIESENRLAKVG